MSQTPTMVLAGTRKVIEMGNSLGVTIPAEVHEEMDVELGDEVDVLFDRDEKQLLVARAEEA